MPRYIAIIDTDTEFGSPEDAAASISMRLGGWPQWVWKDPDVTVYQDLDDMLMDAGEGVGPFDLSDKRGCARDSA